MKRHWYFITYWVCVICGQCDETRERRYSRRPKDPRRRHEYIETGCPEHFL